MQPAVNGAVTPTGYRMGGHAWLINGVNLRAKLFFCINSWGEQWGKGGQCWECWLMEDVYEEDCEE